MLSLFVEGRAPEGLAVFGVGCFLCFLGLVFDAVLGLLFLDLDLGFLGPSAGVLPWEALGLAFTDLGFLADLGFFAEVGFLVEVGFLADVGGFLADVGFLADFGEPAMATFRT